jgi:hypothetical protein
VSGRQPTTVRDDAESVAVRLCDAGVVLAGVAFGVLLLGHLANHALFDGDYWNLNPGTEGNAWTWASSVAVFAAGFALLVRAVAVEERRWYYGGLGAALAFFSLDDAVEIHERIGRWVGTRVLESAPGWLQNRTWLVLYVPLLVFAAVALWRESNGTHHARRTLRLGLLLLVAGIATEVFGVVTKPIDRRGVAWPDILRIGVEEGLELAGWIVVASGLTALVYLTLVAAVTSGSAEPETGSRP